MNSITRSIKQHGATKAIPKTKLAMAVALALSFPALVLAADVELPRIDVVGEGGEVIAKLPGSVAIITQEELALTQPLSTRMR